MSADGSQPRTEHFGEALPLVEELVPPPDPVVAFRSLAGSGHCLFLDSALRHASLGRYSFLTADPFEILRERPAGPEALRRLAALAARFVAPRRAELPPFQGGWAGLWSYDLARSWEPIPAPRYDEFEVPDLAIGCYDVVLAWDHVAQRAWLISQGFPETDPALRRRRAAERLAWFHHRLASADTPPGPASSVPPLAMADLAPQYAVSVDPAITSNLSADGYRDLVAAGLEAIRAGEVFQVNLAQRLLHPAVDRPVELYLRLRRRNPATFGGYFDLGAYQILSASPERFLQVVDGRVETRPIKGTRRRSGRPEADLYSADELLASPKDRAENVMIVDLLRNDLSRVCQADSVQVQELCRVERYEYVTHLVSVVTGRLAAGQSAIDLLAAAFPGGSITGAPKIRAMQLIAELEPTARGAYCGALGYLGFDGTLDTNILIRTVTAGRGWWQAPVGGGIVVDSDPGQEYAETWHKAAGLLKAFAR